MYALTEGGERVSRYRWRPHFCLSQRQRTLSERFRRSRFFGDSFSDTGNTIAGRFSDGLVWTDYMAQHLGLPADAAPAFAAQRNSGIYAVAGAATTASVFPNTSTQNQLDRWLTRPGGAATDATGLYTYFGGANDILNAAQAVAGGTLTPQAAQLAAIQAALNVGQGASALATAGAKFILLPNVVDLGRVPRVQAIPLPGAAAAVTGLTALFNATLASQIVGLRSTFTTTTFFDLRLDILLDNVFHDAARGGAQYGITNTTQRCDQAGPPFCGVSLFHDDLHPTALAHSHVADAAYRLAAFDRNVVVPEPATWALTLLGATLLAVRRSRKVVATRE